MSSTMSATDILKNMPTLKLLEQLYIRFGGAAVGLTEVKTTKKESTRKGKPTCNGDFTKKICAEHKGEYTEFKMANPEKKGAHLIFLSNYKKEHKEEYEAFETAWKEAHPKVDSKVEDDHGSVSDAGSGAPMSATGSGSATGSEKAKRVLSPEHLAKMKVGREAAKAKKEAEKAVPSDTFTATTVAVPAVVPVKKTVKKAQKEIIEPVAVISAANSSNASVAEDDEPELIPFKHGGVTYMRLGNKRADGNYLWATGDLWANKKGAKGAYVGAIQDDGSVDTDALEPLLE